MALLTDFGTRDWYVGAVRGVVLSRAPELALVDITHDIPPQDILAGAFTLAAAAPWFPHGTVFLAVVDPGVGGRRDLIAVQADGRTYVGPDNGLLWLALRRAASRSVVVLRTRRLWLAGVSSTFHGRDILAPVAAHLARGGSLAALGPAVRCIHQLELPSVTHRSHAWVGEIVHIDGFGNLITNLPRPRRRWREVRYRGQPARVVSSYVEGRAQELVALVGSSGFVELAVRDSSAAARYDARRGDMVELML